MDISGTKKRLLLLLEYLYKNTDEEHQASTNDITVYLKEHGFVIDRKTLRSDLNLLLSMDYDIVTVKSSPNRYFWGERAFELPELKMLLDAVSSARFITEDKSRQLIRKITSLAGTQQVPELKRHITAIGKSKSDNKSLYYIIDTITNAINSGRKIQFQYVEYNGRKETILRNNGEVYVLSPYVLYWNEDYYYVLGYSDKRSRVTAFRIDRMKMPQIMEESAAEQPDDFDITAYSNKVFQMFDGKEVEIRLECENGLMKYVIDRFGLDIETEELTEDIFVAKVAVELSPTFYGWVFQFGGKIRIIGPDEAMLGFQRLLDSFTLAHS